MDNGVDLLALALLMPTLRDWLVICQRSVPVVLRFGVNMPAVTIKLLMTKQDMRKGRKTGWPVSVHLSAECPRMDGKILEPNQGVTLSPRSSSPAISPASSSRSRLSCRMRQASLHFRDQKRKRRAFYECERSQPIDNEQTGTVIARRCRYTHHTNPGEEVLHHASVQLTDLGSAISADCLTLPQ